MEAHNTLSTAINISDWMMIAAVLLGPILAVQTQKFIERRTDSHQKRISVFRDLMTTRSSTLAEQHVAALNMVGLEFIGRKYTKVTNAWTTYLDHLSSYPENDIEMQKVWVAKKNDQLSDLLYEMGESLGFQFDKVHIKKAGYTPKAYTDQHDDQTLIRQEMVKILKGDRAFPIDIKNRITQQDR